MLAFGAGGLCEHFLKWVGFFWWVRLDLLEGVLACLKKF